MAELLLPLQGEGWDGDGAVCCHTFFTPITELKTRIHTVQYAALRVVNKERIALYRDIGKLIEERQATEGLGKAVVERLSADLRAEFGEKSGFAQPLVHEHVLP